MLINKKKIIMLLVTIIIAISTYSYGTSNGTITGETVKLRESASLNAKLLILLSVNNKVEVLGQEGDWYRVKYQDKTGYVYKDYIKVEEDNNTITTDNTQNSSNTNTDNDQNNNTNANENGSENLANTNTTNNAEEVISVPSEKSIIEDSKINLLPLINSSTIANIQKDTKITVTEYKNGWAYIISSNASGWIRKEKLQNVNNANNTNQEQPDNSTDTTENTNQTPVTQNSSNMINKTLYVNVGSVRVRQEASTTSNVVDSLVLNNKVIVIGEENDWYKIKVNGQEGYIVKKYLSEKETEVTNRGNTVDREEKTEENSDLKQNETTTQSTNGNKIVEYAKSFLGYNYVSGGSTPRDGFDCSGYTYYVYKQFGYTLNRSSASQNSNGKEVQKANLQAGDLVLFSQGNKEIGHVGIYIGNNNFIHAANKKKGVIITSLSNSYYKANYVTARRIIN